MRRSGRRRAARLVASLAVVALALGIVAVRGRFIVGSQPVTRVAPDPWTTTITIPSAALGRDMAAQVFLPPNLDPQHRAPVLFLFHGRGGDERSWMAGQDGSGVGVDAVAHGMISAGTIGPLVIVSARIDDSYGVDSLPAADGYDHGPYERYIIEDLVPAIEARYPVGGDPAHRAVGGFSMGAFAALHAALRHPGIFGSVGALSPAFFVSPPTDRSWIYGDDAPANDPLALAATLPAGRLRVFLGYGDRDYGWIQDATRALAARLANRGTAADPVVVPGGHEVATWRLLAPTMLEALFGPASSADLDPLAAGVDVEGVAAEEADERHPDPLGRLDGQVGWGRDRRDERDPGDRGLLDDLEADPTGYEEQPAVQRQLPGQGGRPDQLVQRIVPSHVLAERQELPRWVEEPGGVQAAGPREDHLAGAESFRKTEEDS